MHALRFFSFSLLATFSVISTADYNTQALVLIKSTRLGLLPEDVWDHIASFLEFGDRETNEEFVVRASKLKEIPEDLRIKVLNKKTPEHLCFTFNDPGLLSYSIDGQKLYRFREEHAVYGQLPHGRTMSKTSIKSFDVKTLQCEDLSVHFGETFNFFLDIRCFAISCDETQSAQLIRHDNEGWLKDYRIVCRRGKEIPYQTFIISEIYDYFVSTAFNKQATKIIMFARENITNKYYSLVCEDVYRIFPLVCESEHEEKSKKTLVGYFAQLIEKRAKQ